MNAPPRRCRRRSVFGQFGPIGEKIQGLGISQGVLVGNGQSVNHLAYGQFHLFHVQGVGNVVHGKDLGRHVTRRGVGPNGGTDASGELIGEFIARQQFHEKDHAHIAFPVLADDNGILHLGKQIHLPIDLGGTDPHAAGV